MKKVNSKQKIELQKEDAKLVKEIIELEKSNVEAHRIAKNEKESEYEKRLKKLAEELATP